jgi:hypothetical protein
MVKHKKQKPLDIQLVCMGYTAAVLNKHSLDASHTIISMLKNAGQGPSMNFGIADTKKIEYGKNVQDYTELYGK